MRDLQFTPQRFGARGRPLLPNRSSFKANSEISTPDACACGGSCPRCAAGSRPQEVLQRMPIGARDDSYEREASAVADRFVRGHDSAAAHSLTHLSTGESASSVIHSAEAPPVVVDALSTAGQPLEASARTFFEPRLGRDFGVVRIHTGPVANASARAVDARAYTVGSNIVFAEGQYAPASPAGRRLLAHELTHTVQQGQAGNRLQRAPPDTPDAPLKEAKKEDATGAMEGGLKTVADAASKDDKLKKFGVDFAKRYALPVWNNATDSDKAAAVAGAAAIYGTGIAALASNPAGRDKLSGVNFIAPLGLIPYATLNGFSFDVPKLKTDPLLLHFSFKGDDLLDLAHQKLSFVPPLSLSFDITLSVAPDGKVTTPFALAKFGVLPGVSVSAGYGVATDLPQLVSPGPGQPLAPYKNFPQPAQPAPPAGVAVFVGVDLLKTPILPLSVRHVLGADTGDKK